MWVSNTGNGMKNYDDLQFNLFCWFSSVSSISRSLCSGRLKDKTIIIIEMNMILGIRFQTSQLRWMYKKT